MIGDDLLAVGDCGALLDDPTLPILLDRTPWRLSPWTLSTYPPRRPTIAELFTQHMPDDMVVTLTSRPGGYDYVEDRTPDARTAAERLHARMQTVITAVHEIAHEL